MGYKVSQIALWDTQIRPYKEDRYIPNENTVIYYPLLDDYQDHSWKSVTTTTTGTPSITTLDWVKCCYFNGSSTVDTSATLSEVNSTMSAWVYQTTASSMFLWNQPCWITQWIAMTIESSWYRCYIYNWSSSNSALVSWTYTWAWHLFTLTNRKLYIDWVYKTEISSSASLWWNQPLNIWWHNANSSCTRSKITWYVWETFVEIWERDSDKILKYYNNTRPRYYPPINPWIVNEHTLAYYPLNWDANDYSLNTTKHHWTWN